MARPPPTPRRRPLSKTRRPGQNGIILLCAIAMPILAVIAIAALPIALVIVAILAIWIPQHIRRSRAELASKIADHKNTWGV